MKTAILAAALCVCAATDSFACMASFYGAESGTHNADGSRFQPMGLSMAHPTARLGSHCRVTLRGRSIVLPVKDRGPARWTGRCADLSHGAARFLGFERAGTANITLECGG